MNLFSTITATLLLSVLAHALAVAQKSSATSNIDTTQAVELSLSTSDRQFIAGGPCRFGDYRCMSNEALKETNNIRRSNGLGSYRAGTISQLNNAIRHSQEMAGRNRLFHQTLGANKLGCGAFFSGENVAQNFVSAAGNPSNLARMCVNQLKNSPPHFRNIVSRTHQDMTMGIYVTGQGKVYCTQTFAQNTRFGRGGCASSA